MRIGYAITVLLVLLLASTPAWCQPPVPAEADAGAGDVGAAEPAQPQIVPQELPLTFDFEDDADAQGWAPLVEGTTLTITHEPDEVRQGQGALRFDYEPVEDYYLFQYGGLQVPGAKSLSFSVKASEKTPFLYGLGEGDGSAYDAFMQLPANQWVDVEASLDDLQLRPGSDDENGELDSDQITTIVFFDLSNMPGEDGRALGWKRDPQKLCIDNVVISDQEVPSIFQTENLADGNRRIVVADFESDNLRGLGVGGATLDHVAAGRGQALKITYQVGPERWSGIVIGVEPLDLAGLATVKMRLKSAGKSSVNVVLEERGDKSQYERLVDVAGDGTWQSREVKLADFALSETSEDENEQIDLGEVRVLIVVVDTYNSEVDALGQGSVTVDDIEFICGPAVGPLGRELGPTRFGAPMGGTAPVGPATAALRPRTGA